MIVSEFLLTIRETFLSTEISRYYPGAYQENFSGVGEQVTFPDSELRVFPVEVTILVDPLKSFSRFLKVKSNFQSFLLLNFPPFLFHFFNFPHFPPSLFHFSSSFSIFLPFFLASFLPICHQKFPGGKSMGAFFPLLPPPPAYYTTDTTINKDSNTAISTRKVNKNNLLGGQFFTFLPKNRGK